MCFRPSLALIAVLGSCMTACGGRARTPAPTTTPVAPTANVGVGDCGDPGRNGVVSAKPSIKRADLDLNNDGDKEPVVADRALCSKDNNCHWNIFVKDPATGCHRYAGTVAGAGLERATERGDDGFADLRGWWDFGASGRLLLQHYRYRSGAYRIIEAMICRRQEGDRLLCAEGRKPRAM